MPKVVMPLADGVEEMEAVIVADCLRRAKWDVVLAGLKTGEVKGSRGIRLVPDTTWDKVDLNSCNAAVIPGGSMGVENLMRDVRVLQGIQKMAQANKVLAAVCAGPLVLQQAGVLTGKKATCHPDVQSKLHLARYFPDPIVVDGNFITSQGAGTCFSFALAIITKLENQDHARQVARGIVWRM